MRGHGDKSLLPKPHAVLITPSLCAVFRVSAFEGQPVRTDEMEPLWFEPGQVPFENMWADDIHW